MKFSKQEWQKSLNDISKNPPQLWRLDFSRCDLDDNNIKELLDALEKNKTVTAIDLSWNRITPAGAKYIAQSKNNIIDVNLSFNQIGDGAACLFKNKKFIKLDLSFNQISYEGVITCTGNSTLKWLSLRSNQIGDEGAKFVANNKNIEYLDICSNHIGDKGIAYFADNNKTITTLIIPSNKITDVGALAVSKKMYGLKELHIGNNLITEISKKVLEDNAPKESKGVRSLKNMSLFTVRNKFLLDDKKIGLLPPDLIELVRTPEIKVNF